MVNEQKLKQLKEYNELYELNLEYNQKDYFKAVQDCIGEDF